MCLNQGFFSSDSGLFICNFSPCPWSALSLIAPLIHPSLPLCEFALYSPLPLIPPGAPCVPPLPPSIYLSLHLGSSEVPIRQAEEVLLESRASHHSPRYLSVFAYKHISACLHVRGTGKNAAYSHILSYYDWGFMLDKYGGWDAISIPRRPEGALLKFYCKWQNSKTNNGIRGCADIWGRYWTSITGRTRHCGVRIVRDGYEVVECDF